MLFKQNLLNDPGVHNIQVVQNPNLEIGFFEFALCSYLWLCVKFAPQEHFLRAVAPVGSAMILCEVRGCDDDAKS